MDGEHIVGDINRGSRKRKRNITSKERKNEIRYSDHDPELLDFEIRCNHKIDKFKCKELSMSDIKLIKANFYQEKNKNVQDNKLGQMMDITQPKRTRKRKNGKSHDYQVEYNVWKRGKKVLICQNLFMSIFNCGQSRIRTIAKKKMEGKGIKDHRGGDMRSKKNLSKLENVMKFISALKGRESHYGRSKSKRIYLPAEFNIKRLWKIYNERTQDQSLKVNYKYFSRVFSNKYNIAFGSPATDVCGFCIRIKTEIENCKIDSAKAKLKTNLIIHKTRAKQFFQLMKEEYPDSISYCFDLQQIQILPKAPIQEAFYAQQLAFYAFCVTDIAIKTPVFYTWLEHQAGKGVIEISSALTNFLNKVGFDPHIKHLMLYCDGCGGQNKNSHLVHALMLWLFNDAPTTLEDITLTFPVRGHSFMPADRVFGQIELKLRVHAFIKSPEKYYEIYTEKGQVRKLGEDWQLRDVKEGIKSLKKIPGISETKRIIIARMPRNSAEDKIVVKTETLYRNDDTTKQFVSLLKPKKKLSNIHLPTLPLRHTIKKKKLESLSKFLVALGGSEWFADPELKWLEPILRAQNQIDKDTSNIDNDSHDHDEACCCLDADDINVI